MAVYLNKTQDSPLASVEFTPVSDGNFSFFTVADAEQKDLVKTWLAEHMGQEMLAETRVNGKSVFITRGDKTKEQLLEALKGEGDEFQLLRQKKKVDPWRVVSMLAVPGQLLQLTSSFMRKNRRLDWDMFTFAGANLLGHGIAWAYGAQKSEDINQLNFLKTNINKKLEQSLPAGETLLDIDEDRAALRHGPAGTPTTMDKANTFLKANSVYVSEFACRYLGALAIAFPTNKWRDAAGEFKAHGVKAAYKKGRASFTDHPEKATYSHYAGMGSLLGKTIALTSKAEDPYDPKPKTTLDTIREKFTFRTGGWIEAASFATYAADSFTNKDRRIIFNRKSANPKDYVDFVGGAGSILFTIRYIMRHWAKFGVKELDMEELYAHTTDSLAKMPPEKLPQLIADTAADLTEHFKDKKLTIGQVFTQLSLDMYHFHHIGLTDPALEPKPLAEKPADSATVEAPEQKPVPAVAKISAEKTFASKTAMPEKKEITPDIKMPESSVGHIDRLQRETPALAEVQR